MADVLIWTGDAEELVAKLPVDIDLLATDPPYGKPFASNMPGSAGETFDGDADQEKVDRILAAVWAKMRPHRHGYVFGPQRDLQAAYSELIWDKLYMSGGDLQSVWGASHEQIGFYAHRYRSEPRTGELAAKLRRGSVLRVPAIRGSAARNHPAHKPVDLWRRLYEASTLPGDLVVDPFCGGGSSAVAAVLTGRRYIGIELDPTYATRAKSAVASAVRAMSEVMK